MNPLTDTNQETAAPNAEDARLKQYKNLSKHEDMRRRRTECSVEIRKKKVDDLLMKRRNIQTEDVSDDEVPTEPTDDKPKTAHEIPKMTYTEIINILTNQPTVQQMQSCFESIRRSLSKSKNPPVEEVISSGLLQALVQALNIDDDKVRFEAAWAITNIVSGTSEQTMAAINAGATPPLVQLCVHNSPSVAEQALWAVANIAGESAQMRDYVIECHGVEALVFLIDKLDVLTVTHVRTIAWAYSNMCRHKNPNASIEVLKVLVNGLFKLLQHADKQVRQDACWASSYLTDGPDEQIALAKEAGIPEVVLPFLKEGDSMVAPALRVLGNMATGSDDLTQAVIDIGTLHELEPLMERSRSSSVVKECCWLLSNIIAGTQTQIQAVLDAGFIPLLLEVLRSGEFKCQFEASWAIANLCQGGTSKQVLSMIMDDAVGVLCGVLTHTHADLLVNVLESLHTILMTVFGSEQWDHIESRVEESGGLDALESLQASDSEKIYQLSHRIISEFFSTDEDDAEASLENNENEAPYSF